MSDNSDQRLFWSDTVGQIWIDQRVAMDGLFQSVLDGVLERAHLESGHSVLDIGCGAGASTFAAARIVGETGHVTGIDISSTLLGAAQDEAAGHTNVGLLEADAQVHPFVPSSADAIISRFGVMFFDDTAAAFRNIATALRDDGHMSFAAWGAIADNPFFTLPARVARAHMGQTPRTAPDDPGPFALRDPDRVGAILEAAGLEGEVEVADLMLRYDGTPQALAENMCFIGPAHSALVHFNADGEARAALKSALADALSDYTAEDGLSIPAQINYITACKRS